MKKYHFILRVVFCLSVLSILGTNSSYTFDQKAKLISLRDTSFISTLNQNNNNNKALKDRPELIVQANARGNGAAKYSPDGRLILTGDGERLLLWDAVSGLQIRQFGGSFRNIPTTVNVASATGGSASGLDNIIAVGGALSCSAFSLDSKNLVYISGSKRLSEEAYQTVRICDTTTRTEEKTIEIKSAVIRTISFSQDGKNFITADYDSKVGVWDITKGTKVREFAYISKTSENELEPVVLFSPDGKYLFTTDGNKGIGWDVSTGTQVQTFKGHSKNISSAAFSLDGKYIATGSDDKNIYLWDIKTGAQVRRFKNSKPVSTLSISPNNKYLLASTDEAAKVWELNTGKDIREFNFTKFTPKEGIFKQELKRQLGGILGFGFPKRKHEEQREETTNEEEVSLNRILSVDVSPDNKYVLIGGYIKSIPLTLVFDIDTGNETYRLEDYASPISALSISPNGKQIATATDNTIWLWDANGSDVTRLEGHKKEIVDLAFSPDGQKIISGSDDGAARLWDVTTGREILRLEEYEGKNDPEYDERMEAYIKLGYATQSNSPVGAVAFSPDGKFIVTGSGTVARLWDASSGKEIRRLGKNVTPEDIARPTPSSFSGTIEQVVLSPNGKYLLVNYGYASRVRLWDVNTGREIIKLESTKGFSKYGSFSSDSRYALIDENLYDVETGKKVSGTTDIGINAFTGFNVFSPDGKNVYKLSAGLLETFDAKTGAKLNSFDMSRYAYVTKDLVFSPDGRFIVGTGSQDNLVYVLDIKAQKEVCRLIPFRTNDWAVVTPEGRFDTNNLEDIKGAHWLMPDEPFKGYELAIFARNYYEPRLLSRIFNGEDFPPIEDLSQLNRVQPSVKIMGISLDSADTVKITVEVGKAKSDVQRDTQGRFLETNVFNLRLFRDGQLIGYLPETDGEVKLDPTTGKSLVEFAHVKIPHNKNIKQIEFSAYAFNVKSIKSVTDRKTFTVPDAISSSLVKGHAYIITVGANAYQSPRFPNLKFAVNDAKLMQKILSDRITKLREYEDVVTIPLMSDYKVVNNQVSVTEETATKANFQTILNLLAGKIVSPERKKNIPNADKIRPAKPEDLIIIFYSSHGYAGNNSNGVFYLATYDTGLANDLPSLLSHCISSDELSLWLRDVDGGEIAMIIDACHSAAAVEGNNFKPGPMGSRGLGQLSYDKGMRILAATQSDDVALEKQEIQQGLLAYALVQDGLERYQADFKPKDSKIFLSEWLQFGLDRVPALHEEINSTTQGSATSKSLQGDPQAVIKVTESKRLRDRTENDPKQPARKKIDQLQHPSLFDFAKKKRNILLVN